MLSYEDCIALSDLAHDEAVAIAEHERLPLIVAVCKGAHMLRHPWGDAAIRQIVWDNLRYAHHRHHVVKVRHLRALFRDTCERHPARFDRRAGAGRDIHPLWVQ